MKEEMKDKIAEYGVRFGIVLGKTLIISMMGVIGVGIIYILGITLYALTKMITTMIGGEATYLIYGVIILSIITFKFFHWCYKRVEIKEFEEQDEIRRIENTWGNNTDNVLIAPQNAPDTPIFNYSENNGYDRGLEDINDRAKGIQDMKQWKNAPDTPRISVSSNLEGIEI